MDQLKVISSYKNFMKFRYLLTQLVRRDFMVKYRRSVLGIVWSLLNPLFNMIILSLVFSTLFKSNIPNFPVYFLCGSVLFNFFSEATSTSLSSIYSNASLIKKVYFPKYMFPLSKNLFSLVNLLISFIAVLIVMVATKTEFHMEMIFSFIPVVYLFIFSVGISLVLSSFAVFFQDIAHLYTVILTALSFLTPMFYPIDILPDTVRPIVEYNPITQAIQMLRDMILAGQVPTFGEHMILSSCSILVLLLGVFVFYRKQDRFILYI
jgi:ABC-2 type transport system permease protein